MTESTYTALCEALDDEYKAHATYAAVIAAHGPVLPFANIVGSELCHINALLRLFAERGWTPPADRWTGAVTAPASLDDACRTGVAAEIENAALYDRLFAMTDDRDVLMVFHNLRRASADCHLPAFQQGAAPAGRPMHGHHGGGRCCGGHPGRGCGA